MQTEIGFKMNKIVAVVAAVVLVVVAVACAGCVEEQPVNKFEPGDLIVSGPGAPSGKDLGMWKVTRYDAEYDKYHIAATTKAGDGGYWVYDDIDVWIEREYAETWFERVAKIGPVPG